ncbi:uncharacterized protein LOC143191946 [Rhynchophorus ferrugineus]|uniref:uncharacterized protein LOC143191946 n=1 Tax=Rhynchophorus ferrugineus TaxID=354439 RepID=UPI003FCD83DA
MLSRHLDIGRRESFLRFADVSRQDYVKLSIESTKLCSPITTRKVKYEALIVDQGRSINGHSIHWNYNHTCKFEVHSGYSKGGVLAVIQNMNLRQYNSGECMDYIELRVRNQFTRRYCGQLSAVEIMNTKYDRSLISYNNSLISSADGLDVTIFIHRNPLELDERTEFTVAFTSYKACSHPSKNAILNSCDEDERVCINKLYFYDGIFNCPYYGCVDEETVEPMNSSGSVGNTIVIGSISVLALIFVIFILLMWATKKHKSCCWADNFAHPTSQDNRNSRVMEMNEQTGARLAEPSLTSQPTVQIDEEKDLPPTYDSLFPNSR